MSDYENEKTLAGMYLNDVYPAFPEPKVGESGLSDELSDEQFVKQVHPHVATEVEYLGSDGDGGDAGWAATLTVQIGFATGPSENSAIRDAWASARAGIEAKPEPLPNTRQEEQFQQWLRTSGYKSESATCIFLMHQAWKAAAPNTRETQELTWGMVEGRVVLLCPHRRRANCGCTDCDPDAPMSDEEAAKRNYWAIPAPKVVDSKEGKCIHGVSRFEVCDRCASIGVDPLPKEQDGEPEPVSHERFTDHISGAAAEVAAWPKWMREGARSSMGMAESVAPPSLPKQEFEDWYAANEMSGWTEAEYRVAELAWNASRTAAPVALPTHQIVERTIQDGRGACLKCSCGRYFIGIANEALAWASFEAHLPEKEGK